MSLEWLRRRYQYLHPYLEQRQLFLPLEIDLGMARCTVPVQVQAAVLALGLRREILHVDIQVKMTTADFGSFRVRKQLVEKSFSTHVVLQRVLLPLYLLSMDALGLAA